MPRRPASNCRFPAVLGCQPWDSLSASQRCEAAHQHDAQHDPAFSAYNTYCFELHATRDELESQKLRIESMPAEIPSEFAMRRDLVADLQKEIDGIDKRLRSLDDITLEQARNFNPPSEEEPAEVIYSLCRYPRLEPKSEWTVSRLSPNDQLSLTEASKLASRSLVRF